MGSNLPLSLRKSLSGLTAAKRGCWATMRHYINTEKPTFWAACLGPKGMPLEKQGHVLSRFTREGLGDAPSLTSPLCSNAVPQPPQRLLALASPSPPRLSLPSHPTVRLAEAGRHFRLA